MMRDEMRAANRPDYERSSGLPFGYFHEREWGLRDRWVLAAIAVLAAVALVGVYVYGW